MWIGEVVLLRIVWFYYLFLLTGLLTGYQHNQGREREKPPVREPSLILSELLNVKKMQP